jgi:hypothetical protein
MPQSLSRGEAVAASASHGVNGIEDFSYPAPTTAFYGYVLINRSGIAGNATIRRLN